MRVRKPIKLIAYLVFYGGFAILFCCGGLLALVNSPQMRTIPNDPNEAWQSIIQERQRREADLVSEFSQQTDEPQGNFEAIKRFAEFNDRRNQIERDIEVLINRTIAKHGEPPPEIVAQLESQSGPPIDLTMPSASPTGRPLKLRFGRRSNPDDLARYQAERDAREQAEREMREQQVLAAQRQQELAQPQPISPSTPPYVPPPAFDPQAEQLAAQEQRDRAARLAAQEQQDRDRAAQQAARNPPPAQAAMQPGGPAANPDVPPGFAVTAVQQVKPKDTVFVRAQDGWFPAVILHRRGAAVTIRYTANGIVDQVTLNRIRLQTDPGSNVDADEGRPAALRPVAGGRDPANKGEPEDDALFIAKPGEQPANTETPAAAPSASAPIAKGPLPMFRTWSNDTGEFKVEAELVGFEFDLVQLKKKDGKIASVRIEILSAEDQAFVRDRYK